MDLTSGRPGPSVQEVLAADVKNDEAIRKSYLGY